MSQTFSAHLTRVTQGLRDQVSDLQQSPSLPLEKTNSFGLPPYVTSQDYDSGNATEGAWMLGQGEEGQPNADATCLLQNYWMRIDRNPDLGQNLFSGTLQGRLDLRMNGDDAVLYCNAINSDNNTNFTTQLDFANAAFFMQSGTDTTLYQSFQVSLQDETEYLLSLGRDEFIFFNITLTDDDASLSLSQSETTGFVLNDSGSDTSMQIKNAAAGAAIHMIGDTTIDIQTTDVAGNPCRFLQWTKNGANLNPPLYVLSSQSADIGLPCVFEWVPDSGFLGIGTNADCVGLQSFQVEMTYGFNLTAGDTASNMKLDGGSGNYQVDIAADESVAAIWNSASGAYINIGLGTPNNGIYMDFGNSLTVALQSGPPASFGNGMHTIQFREIDVCDGGTPMKMIVLASETYSPS